LDYRKNDFMLDEGYVLAVHINLHKVKNESADHVDVMDREAIAASGCGSLSAITREHIDAAISDAAIDALNACADRILVALASFDLYGVARQEVSG
jgi:hypothetical protein